MIALTSRAVCQAVRDARACGYEKETVEFLLERTGESSADCMTAIRRASKAGLIMAAWNCDGAMLTCAGEQLLASDDHAPAPFALLDLSDLRVARLDSRRELEHAAGIMRDRGISFVPLFWSEHDQAYQVMEMIG